MYINNKHIYILSGRIGRKGFCYLEFRLAFLWGGYKIKSVKSANEVFFYKIKLNLKSRLGEEQESGKLGNR